MQHSEKTAVEAIGYVECPKIKDELKKYKNDDWKVAAIKISYHNKSLRDILNNMVEAKSAIIIHSFDE